MILLYVLLGTVFGFALSRSGAADYNYIQGMFLFEEFQLYGIIGTAVLIGIPGVYLLKRSSSEASLAIEAMLRAASSSASAGRSRGCAPARSS